MKKAYFVWLDLPLAVLFRLFFVTLYQKISAGYDF